MSRQLPPAWIMRFFRWFCREELCDAVEGDLLVVYQRKLSRIGALRARLWYFLAVLSFIQPFALKSRRFSSKLAPLDMISSHLKIAYRSLLSSKLFTLINVAGLAMGIAGFVIMTAYVASEFSHDQFHSKADRIVRVAYEYDANDSRVKVAKTAFPLKYLLLEQYPGVEEVVRFFRESTGTHTLKYQENHFTEPEVIFADPEVFQVFDFELEQGNPATALSDMNSIVMTADMARKYFGEADPMGKIIEYNNNNQLKVTGILKKLPHNSHLQFDMLVPTELQRQRWINGNGNNGYDLEQDWQWSGAWQYVLLENAEMLPAFEAKLFEEGKEYFGRPTSVEYQYKCQPLTDIHFHSDMSGEFMVNGNLKQVYGFAAIAVLILLIACINFVNLSTARSARRAKEVGLRKVMGAIRSQLIAQFISESVLISVLATALAILLTEGMMPYFNHFMGTSLVIPYLEETWLIPSLLMAAIAIGFLAGIYPAFYLSRFKAIKTLKGNTTTDGRGNAGLRKGLVTLQFLIANLLIIGILVVQEQLEYIKKKDLGFDKDQVVILEHGRVLDGKYATLKKELNQLASVATVNRGYVAGTTDWTQTFRVNGQKLEAGKNMGIKHVGFDFLEMFDMELVAGRNFQRVIGKDWRGAVLLNETAVKRFGWTNEEALGKIFSYIGGSDNRTRFECKVIGIVADAHLESLYQPIRPSVFKLAAWGDVSVKLNAVDLEQTRAAIAEIEAVWNQVEANWPFEFKFLDETLAAQYVKEERLSQTIQFFTLLAIFIACLGLFALASFTVQQRTREIGVRKVLGASVFSILSLVSRRFFALIAISFLISVPLGFYFASQWLQEFEYRIQPGPGTFLLAGTVSILIAAMAIGGQSLRAATLNPAQTLKHE